MILIHGLVQNPLFNKKSLKFLGILLTEKVFPVMIFIKQISFITDAITQKRWHLLFNINSRNLNFKSKLLYSTALDINPKAVCHVRIPQWHTT